MALCPFARHRLISPGSNDPRINARVAILHVDAGNSPSLFSYFRYRSGGIESHFHVKKNGQIEQYRDTGWQADANYRANDFAVSIETQGYGSGKWNAKQLASIKRLLVWLNKAEGIPLRKCPSWDGSGVGYHIQFGSPGYWTNVSKSCPGPRRIRQFNNDIVPWMRHGAKRGDWVDMASKKDLAQVVRDNAGRASVEWRDARDGNKSKTWSVGSLFSVLMREIVGIGRRLDNLKAKSMNGRSTSAALSSGSRIRTCSCKGWRIA